MSTLDQTPTNLSSVGFSYSNPLAVEGVGDTVSIQLGTDAAVSVTGTPLIQLNDGEVAAYDPASSTPQSLNFINTVQPGDSTPDLQFTGLNLNGGQIVDANGNPLQGVLPSDNFAGDLGITIDSQPPQLTFDSGVRFYNHTIASLSGTVSDASGVTGVEIFGLQNGNAVDLGGASLPGDGTWTFKDNFGPGKFTGLYAEATDAAGNVADVGSPLNLTVINKGYVYSPGSGPEIIDDFKLSGPNHDVLTLPKSEFKDLVAHASQIHNVPGGGVEAQLAAGDSITLKNVTKTELKAAVEFNLSHPHSGDFHFG